MPVKSGSVVVPRPHRLQQTLQQLQGPTLLLNTAAFLGDPVRRHVNAQYSPHALLSRERIAPPLAEHQFLDELNALELHQLRVFLHATI